MPLEPPSPLRERYSSWTWSMAWDWEAIGTTWRVQPPGGDAPHFLKVRRVGRWPPLAGEAERLRWARRHLPVPEVRAYASDGEVEWLVTVGLPGVDATRHPRRDDDPEQLVRALGRGLREFHEAAPADFCPFDFRLDAALRHARARVAAGLVDAAEELHGYEEFAHHTPESALAELERRVPADEDVVVCHGDYCFPNVLLDRAGSVTGYVDLGELGVADRWWDLAVGAWSVTWNAGPGLEDAFLDAYGVGRDDGRIAFYRLLYALAS